MKNKIKFLSVPLFFIFSEISFGQNTDYLTQLLPPGVSIGINGGQLTAARKSAIRHELPKGGSDPEKNYDLIERCGPATISWFYIRNDVLSGYMRTTKVAAIGENQREVERELIIPGNNSGFVKESEEQALRVGQDLEPVIINVSRWKLPAENLILYTVSTNQEITAVVFNPSEISREIFFARPELKKGLDEQAQAIRKKLNDTLGQSPVRVERILKKNNTPTFLTPTPRSSLAPITQASPTLVEVLTESLLSNRAFLIPLAIIIGGFGFALYHNRRP